MGNGISDKDSVKAYESLKEVNEKIKKKKSGDYFLIKAISIPKYIEIIKRDDFTEDRISDEKIIKHFRDYEKEKIIFLHNFVQCFHLAEQDIEEQNKFIIADEKFVDIISKDKGDKNRFKINIIFDGSLNKIKFTNGIKDICFEKIVDFFYKFNTKGNESLIESKDDTDSNKDNEDNDDFNPITISNKKITESIRTQDIVNDYISNISNKNKKNITTSVKTEKEVDNFVNNNKQIENDQNINNNQNSNAKNINKDSNGNNVLNNNNNNNNNTKINNNGINNIGDNKNNDNETEKLLHEEEVNFNNNIKI